MAAMKPRTGDGPLEVTKEGRGIVMRVPLEGGGRLVVELSADEAAKLGDALELRDEIAGRIVLGEIVRVAGIEHRVQQLLLGLEMMQQAGRADPGLLRDLPECRAAASVPGEQPLCHGQDPLPTVFSLGQEGGIRPLSGHPAPFN